MTTEEMQKELNRLGAENAMLKDYVKRAHIHLERYCERMQSDDGDLNWACVYVEHAKKI
jgi:hypothetical protein